MYRMVKRLINLNLENASLLKNLSSANKILSDLATHDPLTKIDNRRLFYINLENSVKRAERNHQVLALFFLDLDHFKVVNDTYGHDIGDKLLLLVAQKLKEAVREVDSCIPHRW